MKITANTYLRERELVDDGVDLLHVDRVDGPDQVEAPGVPSIMKEEEEKHMQILSCDLSWSSCPGHVHAAKRASKLATH